MHWRTLYFSLCVLLLSCTSSSAQRAFQSVDRQKVESLVNDASLPTFYPALLDRFVRLDKKLSLSDYRLLYYGWVFQPGYSWNANQRRKEMRRAMQGDDYALVIRLADTVLRNNPVSLTALYYRTYAMMNTNDKDSAFKKYVRMYSGIRDAILSSGDGLRCNTAFRTICLEDENEIMQHCFEVDRKQSPSGANACDRFVVTPSGTYLNEEMFFDTSEILLCIKRSLKQRQASSVSAVGP